MPYKNKTKNNSQLRQNNRRNWPHMQSAIPNQIYANGFPREMKVKLVYFQTGYITTTSGGIPYDYQFRLNSIFDPDYTSTGHQPLGRDQWAAFYGRYRVDSALVQATLSSPAPAQFTILANNSQASIVSQSEAEETPFCSTKQYAPGGSTCSITRHFDLPALNGVTRSVYESDDRYQASFSANPTEVLQLHVVMTAIDNSASAMYHSVKITYYCTLFDPIALTLS